MKVVIPDLVSNSYFPAIAAVEMGFFKEEGIDAELELIYPVGKCYRGAARRQGRFRRRFVAFGADRVSGMAGREVSRGAGAVHLLVPDHALGPQGEARRPVLRQGPQDRRGADDRHRPDRTAQGMRHRSEARQRADRAAADAGQSRRRVVRRQCRQGDGGGQDRRLLGQRHGRRGRGAARRSARWCSTPGAATARRACAATPLACWRRAPIWSRNRPTTRPPRCARWSRRKRR